LDLTRCASPHHSRTITKSDLLRANVAHLIYSRVSPFEPMTHHVTSDHVTMLLLLLLMMMMMMLWLLTQIFYRYDSLVATVSCQKF